MNIQKSKLNTQKKLAMASGGAVLVACLAIGGLAAANAETPAPTPTPSTEAASSSSSSTSSSTVTLAASTPSATVAASTAPAGSSSAYIDSLVATLTPQQQAALSDNHWDFNLLIGMLTTEQDKALLAEQQSQLAAIQSANPADQAAGAKFAFNVDTLRKKLGE